MDDTYEECKNEFCEVQFPMTMSVVDPKQDRTSYTHDAVEGNVMKPAYTVKDSGERMQFESGMQRDTVAGKVNWALVADGPMLARWAEHLTKGANKYDDRNWMKANGERELQRFKESAFRHFMQWYYGWDDEDHAAAVFFNLNGAEYVREQMEWDENLEECYVTYGTV